MKKPTLDDVAEIAGVSPRTVSRVVNDEDGFSESTRQRVAAAIKQVGYRPNLAARTLVTNRTGSIGLVVSQLTDPYFPEIADGVMAAARERNFNILLSTTEEDAMTQTAALENLVARAVDAVILFPTPNSDAELQALADSGLPLVVVDHELSHPNIAAVTSDIRAGGGIAADYLLSGGHERVAMVANSVRTRGWRESQFRAVVAEHHAPSVVVHQPPTREGGRLGIAEILQLDPAVTGVFAYNDLVAIGIIQELRALGLRVPEDIAVVGFDDVPFAEFSDPPLTTVRLSRERVGAEAVRLAIGMLDVPGRVVAPVVFPVSLIRRVSA